MSPPVPAASSWRRVFRDAGAILCVGAVLGLGANAVRSDGLDLGGIASGSTASVCAPPSEGTQWIPQEQALALVARPDVTFIDARPVREFQEGHVAGAYAIPYAKGDRLSPETIAPLAGAATVITYCDTSSGCACSVALAEALLLTGLRDVRVLEGGWPEWIARGQPVEAGDCLMCPDTEGAPHDAHE